ncbi:Isochorismate synthase siderophore [Tenacibaculum sp. 190130A14a]|uniref:isochorismate synthase n=1 Tax=Tenacibaculum polynesiense TaxID=3137857 RepID=A0ABM9P925_9FLAO
MSILEKIKIAYHNHQPFVAYRKPKELSVNLYIQKNDALHTSSNLTESGFIFAPFDNNNPSVLIPFNQSEFSQEEITITNQYALNNDISSDISSKKSHLDLVTAGVEAIQNGNFKKVVLSRKEQVALKNIDISSTFKKLLYTYSTAMVYVWYHPKVGLWFGATPETLIKVNHQQFQTMSLAGTQVYQKDKEVTWEQKEIDEQQFVTDFILDKLTPITTHITTSRVNTIKAGNLVHLQTKISGEHSNNIAEIIEALHPTPAVCGLPKKASKQFIIDNENYDRTYYTGFLGELNLNNNSSIFVNLRCMEIQNNIANIYVGGGITIDSSPEKEWLETVAKTGTMKKVL